MLRTVAYVVNYFPLPSETFIADEAFSLYGQNIQPCILYLNRGNLATVHQSAQALLDGGKTRHLATISRANALGALGRLLLRAPLRTLRTAASALAHPKRWLYMQALPAAAWCLREGVEFLHAHFAAENFEYASVIAAWTGIPYGVTAHRYDIFEDPIDKSTAIGLFKEAAVVVTISEFSRRFMAEKYGLPRSRIHVVHCGIDLERFAFSARMPRQFGQTLRILNVGRLVPEKAQDVLLTALGMVKARGVPFVLDIVGSGPRQDELMALATTLELGASVVFHGAQNAEFVRERLVAADLFVLSSRIEGLPVVCMEALAVGTPVIATRIFGVPELIEDGVSGLLVPVDDPLALADAMHRAYASPTLLQSLPAAGRRVVEAGFERRACTGQLVQLWNQAIIGGGQAQSPASD